MSETTRRSATVVLIDDHELARRGLRAVLETAGWLSVAGEAAGCQDGVDVVRRVKPAIVLLDIRMPGIDGLECLERLKRACPRVVVIIVTLYDDRRYVLEAIRRGASGYLGKDATGAEILATLERALDGQLAVDPDLLRDALGSEERAAPRPEVDPNAYRLTPRERDVLALVAEGMTNKEIGGRLKIGEDTAKKHVQNLIWKLRAADRTQAAILAYRLGILGPAPGDPA